ncbi:phosphatase PAP2 family protein [Photobacterium leiognathi]|uniref:phosphatase PAP2 family protein n=1 Tax=Photobacterium leiognathi TaxID=553611 RepID=UPI0006B40027|nr:phosphatase PAP2 family protein [Photobacterium leiognathi]KPA54549.1 phosphoesterase [Photobacterium leiognathi subsp. mandapamensis]
MKRILFAIPLLFSSSAFANYETVGDVGQFAVPLAALAVAYAKDDTEGMKQLFYGWGITQTATHITKTITQIERPNGKSCNSFPSGHTASAFSGATFLHHRYGIEYGFPAYLASVVVGHSRVHANKHWATDVVGAAALAYGVSYFITTQYEDPNLIVSPANFGKDASGVLLSYTF